jgi:hypothetical protein
MCSLNISLSIPQVRKFLTKHKPAKKATFDVPRCPACNPLQQRKIKAPSGTHTPQLWGVATLTGHAGLALAAKAAPRCTYRTRHGSLSPPGILRGYICTLPVRISNMLQLRRISCTPVLLQPVPGHSLPPGFLQDQRVPGVATIHSRSMVYVYLQT